MVSENQFFNLLLCLLLQVKKKYKEPRIKLFKKINKPVLSHITFYLKDDDHKPVDFNGETISFTCQLVKLYYSYLYKTWIHTII